MDIALSEEQVVKELWLAYKKKKEYKDSPAAIPPHFYLVEEQEKLGLQSIYISFIKNLESSTTFVTSFRNRTVGNWLAEWKQMNKMLFQHVLRECGEWRKNEVRFGSVGDEELYRIPNRYILISEINKLASEIFPLLSKKYKNNDEKFKTLAYVHYQFVRIHPFSDGNGRIARAITDQLAVFLGFPPAMSGYPRHDYKSRENYHKAIRACVDDPDCTQLSQWIGGYIEQQLKRLA